jgi:hypothetical protein
MKAAKPSDGTVGSPAAVGAPATLYVDLPTPPSSAAASRLDPSGNHPKGKTQMARKEQLDSLTEFLEAQGQPHIAEQLRMAVDKPGCVRPLAGCYWWLQAGKLRARSRPRCPAPLSSKSCATDRLRDAMGALRLRTATLLRSGALKEGRMELSCARVQKPRATTCLK